MLTFAKAGTPDADRIDRVVDATTGETVAKVIEADTERGWLRRYSTDEAGKIRIENREAVIVEEARAIRFILKGAA